MSMNCKECGKELDFNNDCIICEECKIMYFKDKGALENYLKKIHKSICDLNEVAFVLHQKELEDSKSLTIMENKVLDDEQKYRHLKDEMDYLASNNYYEAQEKKWAQKLYSYNHVANFLIKFYKDKLNDKDNTQWKNIKESEK